MKTLDEWLAWQEGLYPTAIKLGVDHIRTVAQRMGLLQLPVPVITVGGTNGKGSTCAMLTRILQVQGYQVGTYTSPHLRRYNERIAINAVPVDDAMICAAFQAIDEARAEVGLTYFEFGTLAAVWCFLQAKVDVVVLEVGLGGRLDACNAWDADVAIITSIGIDHVHWLGNTRESVAREKAGIMREGKPVLCGDPQPPVTLEQEAARVGARYLQFGRDFSDDGLPQPALVGGVQRYNAACVVAALRELSTHLPVKPEALVEGLRTVSLSGRMQRFNTCPEVLLDVAHNPHAAVSLADWLKKNPIAGKTAAIFSILADKDVAGVVEIMAMHMDEWHLVPLAGCRAIGLHQLGESVRAADGRSTVYFHDDFQSAWRFIQSHASASDRVVAFGSFLVVSGMLDVLVT